MTFAELFDTLNGRGVLTNAPVKKSYLKSLAIALGYDALESAPVADTCLDPDTWLPALTAHFDARTAQAEMGAKDTQGKKVKKVSALTIRNTKSELRTLFRLADEQGLLPTPLTLPVLTPTTRYAFEREQRRTRPYKGSYNNPGANPYWLRQAAWPPDIAQGWQRYRVACGRRIRETTFGGYVKCLESFFGYRLNICHETPTWDDLFDPDRLDEFVSWHARRVGQDDTSAHGWHVVIGAAAIARVVGHAKADEVLAFSRTVERPPELHRKREHHWVDLTELDRIAEACLREGRRPYLSHGHVRSPGVRGATRFQLGLILKLMTRRPLRSRNLREMRLGKNLFQDREGHWHLEFRGRELKVGRRGRRTNESLVDLTACCPPDKDNLIAVLEEFLKDYRPRIPNTTPDGPVFLTQLGTPYDAGTLRKEIATIVARYTAHLPGGSVRFHPHMIRTIWGSEYLEEHPGDFAAVAEALGNTIAVVIKTYYDVVPKAEQAKTGAWTSAKFARGAPTTAKGA
jgi:integrase